MIALVTFTGVDEHTPLGKLATIHNRYPKAEFAILIGDQTGKHDAARRFPTLNCTRSFRDWGCEGGRNTAVHLCGGWARAALGESDNIDAGSVIALCEGFARAQLNVPAGFFTNRAHRRIALDRFASQVGCAHVIVQRRSSEEPAPSRHPKVEYLWDQSAGTGREGFEAWPEPRFGEKRCGYAGGIGPANIAQALRFVEHHGEQAIWLDMETNLRTQGWFDLDLVEGVCKTVERAPTEHPGVGRTQ